MFPDPGTPRNPVASGLPGRLFLLAVALAGLLRDPAVAAGPFQDPTRPQVVRELPVIEDSASAPESARHVSRGLTAALAVVLGPFGGHRLYLGTIPRVPLLYGLTFGGFGVLVLIDLGHILFTRDLSAYMDNDQVLMWAGPREKAATPP